MIISNSRQFVFVHIHKTAGTAITKVLEESIEWNDLSITGSSSGNVKEHWYKKNCNLEMHSSARDIRNEIGIDIWDSYFTFSFVRDPYKRILSLYTWIDGLVKDRGIKAAERFLWPDKGIWAWPGTRAYLETRDFSAFIRHSVISGEAPGAKPMVDSLYEDGQQLVKFIGKQEQLDQDILHIRNVIGLSGPQVRRTNVTRAKVDPKKYYTSQADLDLIYERYVEDFEAFGYEKISRSGLE